MKMFLSAFNCFLFLIYAINYYQSVTYSFINLGFLNLLSLRTFDIILNYVNLFSVSSS